MLSYVHALQVYHKANDVVSGSPREGEWRLEEALSAREEGNLPCIILSDLRRIQAPHRRMEVPCWSFVDRGLARNLHQLVDGCLQ